MKTELQRFRWEVLGFRLCTPNKNVFTKGLSNLVALSNLNLSNNYISRLCQLACLPNLHTLNIAKSVTGFYCQNDFPFHFNISPHPNAFSYIITCSNQLRTGDDVRELANCNALSVLDLSHNLLEEPEVAKCYI